MKNIAIIAILFCSTLSLYSQRKKVQNLANFDQRIVHFGFALGGNSADFAMAHDVRKTDSLIVLETDRQAGFNIGIIADLHITPLLSLRLIPTLSFTQRNIEYTFLDGLLKNGQRKVSVIIKPVESTFIDIPLYLKFRSVRLNNFAAYVIGGFKYSLDLASQAKTDNSVAVPSEIVVKLKRDSFLWEIGFGMDFFLEYFKFSPEIKMSYGLTNVFIQDYTDFSNPISRLNSQIFTLSFTFEG